MQRNVELMRKQVEVWRRTELTVISAKMIIYEAFIQRELEVPKHLARLLRPAARRIRPRTMWSLSNAFTSALKELDPIPQFRYGKAGPIS